MYDDQVPAHMKTKYPTGTPLSVEPLLPGDVQLATLGRRYFSRENFISGFIMSIGAMDALVHHHVAAMIVRVYGSLMTQ
jgi:hypothetical protein